MIVGQVNTFCEAVVRLSVRGFLDVEQNIEADEATILWDNELRRIPFDASATDPLIGMRLLYGHEMIVHIFEGGDVSLRALPVS